MNNPFIVSRPGSAFGMQVIENRLAVELVPRKNHEKKRWMSDAYHRRIQKKWTKRFGKKEQPAMYMHGRTIIAHPEIAKLMREAAKHIGEA